MRDWLSAATVFKDQEHATETRADYPNSGRWLLTRGPMKSFLDPQSCTMPLLWMTGKPGAGWLPFDQARTQFVVYRLTCRLWSDT